MKMSADCLNEIAFKKLNPIGYLRSYLQNGIRPDGRMFDERRNLDIKVDVYKHISGSSTISLGETTVTAGVTLLTGAPSHDSPNSGDIEVEVTLGPLCSPKYDRSKSDDACEIEAILKDLLKRSSLLDLTHLCIQEGDYAFRLKVNLLCLSYAGNLVDVCILALTTALSQTKLPSVKVENDRVVIDVLKAPTLIVLYKMPIPVTLGLFENVFLVDPSAEEEEHLDGRFVAVLTEDGSPICIMHRSSKNGFTKSLYEKALLLCQGIAKDIRGAIAL